MTWPPPELRRAVRDIEVHCPDCPGTGSAYWSKAKGRFRVRIRHDPSCVTHRRARSRRACERDITEILAVALHLADYSAHGDVLDVVHAKAAL